MMKKIYLAAATLAVALTFSGCKTTEANYRAAYEVAKKRQTQDDGDEAALMQQASLPRQHTIDGVTLPVRYEAIGYPADGGATPANVKTFNVVVGQFKQIFNARQMRKRLMDNGYPESMIVSNREPVYYVIARTCATAAEAAEALRRVSDDPSLSLRSPLPYILPK